MKKYDTFADYVKTSIDVKAKILADNILIESASELSQVCLSTITNGGKIILAGNGGSFADAQHICAEFISRLRVNRSALPSITLGVNGSNISAIGNDYGYDHVFSREIQALGGEKDLFIPISTSGNSNNITNATLAAQDLGLSVFGLTGMHGGRLGELATCFNAPSNDTAHIQECHIVVGHYVCLFVERELFPDA